MICLLINMLDDKYMYILCIDMLRYDRVMTEYMVEYITEYLLYRIHGGQGVCPNNVLSSIRSGQRVCPNDICCVPQTPLVVRSGSRKQRRHNNHHLILRNPPSWRRLDSVGEINNAAGTTTNREKQSMHKFNEVRPTCLRPHGKGEREILFIQQSIQLLQEGTLEGGKGFFVFLRGAIHEASSLYL